jgi:hypothetical protein
MNPNNLPMYIVGIGGLLCVLSFAALLLQKLYLDPRVRDGKAPVDATVLNIPGFGNISTVYPALAFLIVGAALVPTGLVTARTAEKVPWHVTMHVESNVPIGYLIEGGLALSPTDTTIRVDRQARTITLDTNLGKGQQFEDVFEKIDLTLLNGVGSIDTRDVLKVFKKSGRRPARGQTGLISVTEHTREYQLAMTQLPAPYEEAQP